MTTSKIAAALRRDFKRIRPSDKKLGSLHGCSIELWNLMIGHFPPLQELIESTPGDEVAAQYRNRSGGHLLFRPVGLYIIIAVTKLFLERHVRLSRVMKVLAEAPMNLAAEPWVGLLYDGVNRRMTISGERQRAATQLLYLRPWWAA